MKEDDSAPVVSVIVPVYNVAQYLDRCFASLTAQTYHNIEIIIVDDGSTDGSSSLCVQFANRDKRCCVIHQQNAGLGEARNTGVRNATGEWLMFLDSDDYLVESAIETLVETQKASGADLIVFALTYVSEQDSKVIKIEKTALKNGYIDKTSFSKLAVDYIPYHVAVTKLYKRAAIAHVSFAKGVHEDIDFSHRVLEHIGRIYCIDAPLYCYRQRQTGLSKRKGIERERNHYLSIAWMNVLESASSQGFWETIPCAWPRLRGCLNSLPAFMDDEIYQVILKRFSQWFIVCRKQLKRMPIRTYLEMKDTSRRNPLYYSTGYRVSCFTRWSLFLVRVADWIRRHFVI